MAAESLQDIGLGSRRGSPAFCCLLVDVDSFLPQAAHAGNGWAERTRHSISRIIDGQLWHVNGTTVEHLPRDEWLLTLSSPSVDELAQHADMVAAGIHRTARASGDITITVAVGLPDTGVDAIPEAISSARRVHRSTLALGPDRVIHQPAAPRAA